MAHNARQQPVVVTPVPDLILPARHSSLLLILPECVQLSKPSISNVEHELGIFLFLFLLFFFNLFILVFLFVFLSCTIFLLLIILNCNFFLCLFLFVCFHILRFLCLLFTIFFYFLNNRFFFRLLTFLILLLRSRTGPGTADRSGGWGACGWSVSRGAGH